MLWLVSEVAREQTLRRVLAPLRNSYDVILIDCAPSLGLLTVNALTAADHVIIPLECEFFAMRGVALLVDTIETGRPLIPLAFVGATNNDPGPDTPPLLDLANLNIHHYQAGADFYESAFLMGQPMLAISGVTEEWVAKQGAIIFGSRSALALPQGGTAQLAAMARFAERVDRQLGEAHQARPRAAASNSREKSCQWRGT